MNWWEWLHGLWLGQPLECTVPWWPLRRALAPWRLEHRASILILGAEHEELAELLCGRGYAAVGLDPQAQRVCGDQEAAAQIRFVNKAVALPEHAFDLVLVHNSPAYQHDLVQLPTLLTSANLLSAVRPGGRLTLLVRHKPTWDDLPAGHLRSCYQRHFGFFPVESKVRLVAEGWHRLRTWHWLLGQQPRSGHYVVQVQLPDEALPRTTWQSRAATAGRLGEVGCCRRLREQAQSVPEPAAKVA